MIVVSPAIGSLEVLSSSRRNVNTQTVAQDYSMSEQLINKEESMNQLTKELERLEAWDKDELIAELTQKVEDLEAELVWYKSEVEYLTTVNQ
jgi:hypothetical protein